ncbi:hypothetical protein G7Y89_g5902 [Cudoniella acicularis]|uniref:Uncharacterized protein n=1 Tax=Cudoniella acicularis TaxID=354080 RepID=A0A8H4RLJ1_9HELO|nr:hypothetical protein G7Y89_g5902 [Cudoniella acicularis]
MRQRAEVTLNSSKETDLTPAAGQKSKYESHTCHDDDSEDIRQRIERVSADISDIDQFYNIASSPTRHSRFHSYYTSELSSLKNVPFNSLNQEGKIDYLLLQNHLKKDLHRLSLEDEKK